MLHKDHPDFWLYQDVYAAYYQARKNKRNTTNQLEFELNLEDNICQLAEDLKQRRYQLSRGIAFIVFDPTIREIFAATFRDRVVHHLVYNYIMPYWDKRFIYDSYSCRPGKGTHFGISRVAHFMRGASQNYTRPAWILKMDISGYFMHINRSLMWDLNRVIFHDPHFKLDRHRQALLAYLLPIIIFADPTKDVCLRGWPHDWQYLPNEKSLFRAPINCGFPIGNLTSQLFSNIYLHELDKFIKFELKFRYYGRYVDDFVIIDQDFTKLQRARALISDFLYTHLFLRLHPRKVYLQPVTHGVNFIGARIRHDRIKPSQRVLRHYRQFIQETHLVSHDRLWWARRQSYVGHIRKIATLQLPL